MTDELFYTVIACVAALCGAVVGRIFALEAPDRATAVFAAAYSGTGAGLVSGPPLAFLLALAVKLWAGDLGIAGLIEAVEATGPALLWGPVGGAAGGLLIGLLVVPFKRRPPEPSPAPLATLNADGPLFEKDDSATVGAGEPALRTRNEQ
jgi:hypothetical protein